jgi:lysozyme family protein
MASFDVAITKTLNFEGGDKYTETPGDTGGATKYGISQRAYPHLNIKTLTEADAKAIYKRDYWDKIQGDSIGNPYVAESIFDFAVNSGVSTASKAAQVAASLVLYTSINADGVIGPKTVEMLNRVDGGYFLAVFALQKITRYAAICNKNLVQSKFLLGWVNRTLQEWTQ